MPQCVAVTGGSGCCVTVWLGACNVAVVRVGGGLLDALMVLWRRDVGDEVLRYTLCHFHEKSQAPNQRRVLVRGVPRHVQYV